MAFILDEQRDADCRLAFELYRKYLDFNDHRCPHDGRIISVQLLETEITDGRTELPMSVRLAGAWQGEPQQFEIGVTLSPSRQGQGYATEALECLLHYLFAELSARRISATTDV